MKRLSRFVLTIASWCALCASTSAGTLFSIDTGSDSLVTFDADTGHVTVIGSLGRDFNAPDLTVLNGSLFAVGTDFALQRAELFQIDTASASATSLGQLFRGTDRVTHAEGLTSRSGGPDPPWRFSLRATVCLADRTDPLSLAVRPGQPTRQARAPDSRRWSRGSCAKR